MAMADQGEPPGLVLRNVVKRFGDLPAVDGISLSVPRGHVVVIIGPSGSGKSTLLRTVNLLDVPDSGGVEIGGEAIFMRKPGSPVLSHKALDLCQARARRKTAMVFQRFNLFPHLRVLQNVMLGPVRAKGVPPAEAEALGRALLARVGLSDKAGAIPGPAFGRPAAARRYSSRAGDLAHGDAVRRADLGARSRARRGGPRRDRRTA